MNLFERTECAQGVRVGVAHNNGRAACAAAAGPINRGRAVKLIGRESSGALNSARR